MDVINRILPCNPDSGLTEEYNWDTLSSKMRGNIQTRSLSVRPQRTWSLTFFKLTTQEKNAILNFYNARQGGYDKFLFMPYKSASGNYFKNDNHSDIVGTTGNTSETTNVYLEQYAPAEDDLFNNWTIEIDGTHKIISDYDGFNKKLTTQTFGAQNIANKTYKIRQKIYTGSIAIGSSYPMIANYSSLTEVKKYVYDESLWESGGTLSVPSSYVPKIWIHDGTNINPKTYDDVDGGQNTFKFTTVNKFASNNINYFEAPLIINYASSGTIIGSWYWLYPVRFPPETTYSQNVFVAELFTLNTITLIEVIEPN